MTRKHKDHYDNFRVKTPLWKWLVFILIVLSMPVLFMNYRAQQTENVIERFPASK